MSKRFRIFYNLVIVLIFGSLVCCNEEEMGTDDNYNCNGDLHDKGLDTMRYCIQGTWQIHQAGGGETGQYYELFKDTYIEFMPNDSIYFVDPELKIFDATSMGEKIIWEYYSSWGYDMYIKSAKHHYWQPAFIYSDTMMIFRNSRLNDGLHYFLEKVDGLPQHP